MQLIGGAEAGHGVRFFSLARYALFEAFRLAGVARGDKVLVPAFICRDLLASVHAIQAEPLFYPVGRSLAPQALPSAPGVKAVIAVNYFGFPQSLDPFRAYCADRGAALIEDNAHGFLSRDEQGELLGSRAELGIFSLRKTFALPDGAALLVKRDEWIGRLPAPLPCRSDPLSPGFLVKRALRNVQNTTGISVRSLGEQIVRSVRHLLTGQAFPPSSPEFEREIPGHPAIHRESVRMLEQVDEEHEIVRRRALYHDFQLALRSINIEPLFGELPTAVVPYGYPFRANQADAKAVSRIAAKRGYACSYWPDLPSEVAPKAPDHYKNVWWVNFLC